MERNVINAGIVIVITVIINNVADDINILFLYLNYINYADLYVHYW